MYSAVCTGQPLHILWLRHFKKRACIIFSAPFNECMCVCVCLTAIAVYSVSAMESYKCGQRNLSEQPHVFAIAQEAYGDLTLNRSQSIIIR